MPEPRPYQRVLALIHFDALDRPTAEKALLLARLSDAKLDFLHLVEPDGALDGGYPGGGPQSDARGLESASLRRLDYLAASLGATEATRHALHGPSRQGFRRHVEAWRPDLIVTGEHHEYLREAGTHDVLILSPATTSRRGGLLAGLLDVISLRGFVPNA